MTVIAIMKHSAEFAENKDIARDLRTSKIEPALRSGDEVILDFEQITSVTQSFIHALISQTIRTFGIDILDKIGFKNCNDNIKMIVEIVIDYVQDGIFSSEDEIE